MTGQSARWTTGSDMAVHPMAVLVSAHFSFDDFDDFSTDSIGTGEETDFDLTGLADPAKEAIEL